MLVLLLLVMGACQAPPSPASWNAGGEHSRAESIPPGMMAAHQAALRLGMQVEQSSSQMATLSDGRHRVVILAPPHARVSLDGHPFTHPRVASANGKVYISSFVVSQIESRLRADSNTWTDRTLVESTQYPPPPDVSPVRGTVMIDAGHGGRDPGAPNRYGPAEKHLALDAARRLRDALAGRGVRVVMTRSNDTYPTLDERVKMANRIRPDLFVSVHFDTAGSTQAHGFTLYIAEQASAESVDAATRMDRAMRRTGARSRGVRRKDYIVVHQTRCPAVLVEMGYLSNPTEGRRLSTASYRQRLADAVAEGVLSYLRHN